MNTFAVMSSDEESCAPDSAAGFLTYHIALLTHLDNILMVSPSAHMSIALAMPDKPTSAHCPRLLVHDPQIPAQLLPGSLHLLIRWLNRLHFKGIGVMMLKDAFELHGGNYRAQKVLCSAY